MTMKLKGLLYGKFVKQLFIISLISFFGLLGNSFVNARTTTGGANWLAYQPVGDREYLMNYGFTADSDGDFDSFYNVGNSQLVLYYPPYSGGYQGGVGTHIYGWINGRLYYYGDYDRPYNGPYVRQGFIKNFMHTTKELLFDVNNGPYARWENNLTADEFYSQNHSFSNIYTMSTNGSANALPSNMFRTFCLEESNGVDVYCWSCSASGTIYGCNSEVENSQNYTINDFDDVFNVPYGFSPFVSSSSGTGGQFNPTPGVEFRPCMTLREILALRPQYNEGLCYSSSSIFSGGSFVNITPKSIFDLFPTFNEFNSSMNKYQNYCSMLSTANTCASAFEGEESEYTLISKLPDNVKRQDLYNYCDKVLNYDLNTSSCVASGGFQGLNPRTDLSGGDFMNGILNPTNPLVPVISSGSALDYIWGTYYSGDFEDFISDPDVLEKIGNDALQLFPSKGVKGDYVGILPLYIVIGFIAILLLYFIRR